MSMIKIKILMSTLLSACGVHSLMERFCLSNKAFILMYHRVLTASDNPSYFVQPGMFITAATFEKQICFLKTAFKLIFFEDLVEMIKRGEDIGGYCAITFDDGWGDNYTDAFPILKKHQVPATIFLATGFVGTSRLFWPEEICYYLQQYLADVPVLNGASPLVKRFIEGIDRICKCNPDVIFDASIEMLKGYLPNEREEVLEYFRRNFKAHSFPRQMLSWDEAAEMFASGLIRFGAHTDNHVILDQVPTQAVSDEVTRSREMIEKRLGTIIQTFAYPNGNHNESIQTVLADNGFTAAVTTSKGYVGRNTSLMEIPRIAMHEDVSNTIPMFRSRILFKKF